MKLSLYLYFLRTGGDQDPAKLKYSMERLGFEVIVFKNQTTANVGDLLKKMAIGLMGSIKKVNLPKVF